jgi:hypothetical protein
MKKKKLGIANLTNKEQRKALKLLKKARGKRMEKIDI